MVNVNKCAIPWVFGNGKQENQPFEDLSPILKMVILYPAMLVFGGVPSYFFKIWVVPGSANTTRSGVQSELSPRRSAFQGLVHHFKRTLVWLPWSANNEQIWRPEAMQSRQQNTSQQKNNTTTTPTTSVWLCLMLNLEQCRHKEYNSFFVPGCTPSFQTSSLLQPSTMFTNSTWDGGILLQMPRHKQPSLLQPRNSCKLIAFSTADKANED